MKTIGLIGGMSWESTTLYYQIINREVSRRLGGLSSARMNLVSPDLGKRVERHLSAVGLPVSMDQIPGELPPAEVLLEAITQDKKVKSGKLTFILTRGLGQSFVADDVPASEVLSFLREKRG